MHPPSDWPQALAASAFLITGLVLLARAAFSRLRPTGINAFWTKRTPFTDVPLERQGRISAATYFWLGSALVLWGGALLLRTTTDWIPKHTTSFTTVALFVIFFWRRWADSKSADGASLPR